MPGDVHSSTHPTPSFLFPAVACAQIVAGACPVGTHTAVRLVPGSRLSFRPRRFRLLPACHGKFQKLTWKAYQRQDGHLTLATHVPGCRGTTSESAIAVSSSCCPRTVSGSSFYCRSSDLSSRRVAVVVMDKRAGTQQADVILTCTSRGVCKQQWLTFSVLLMRNAHQTQGIEHPPLCRVPL